MNKGDLVRHLSSEGCTLLREGKRHSIWINPATGETAAIPRHNTIKKNTARQICQALRVKPAPSL
ncbi:MAG: type II toxin-antitoxin system HicA family toxin [Armatimonadetes bacterium]|nr:type II toxin-antitoxin system HicA family toxin [Armatimonadota bacterium]